MAGDPEEKVISPRFSCGVVTADELLALGKLLKETPGCKVKLTGAVLIGIEDAEQRKTFRAKIGVPLAPVSGARVRPVNSAPGTTSALTTARKYSPFREPWTPGSAARRRPQKP